MEREWVHLQPEGGIGFGWQTQDLNPEGACGNALDTAHDEVGDCALSWA